MGNSNLSRAAHYYFSGLGVFYVFSPDSFLTAMVPSVLAFLQPLISAEPGLITSPTTVYRRRASAARLHPFEISSDLDRPLRAHLNP
jgi:hypothetical protein